MFDCFIFHLHPFSFTFFVINLFISYLLCGLGGMVYIWVNLFALCSFIYLSIQNEGTENRKDKTNKNKIKTNKK